MAGRDITRSLAANTIFDYPKHFTQPFDDYLDMTDGERRTVSDWVDFYYRKYPEVGLLVRVVDDKKTPKEDIFSAPGSPPHGGIFTDLDWASRNE